MRRSKTRMLCSIYTSHYSFINLPHIRACAVARQSSIVFRECDVDDKPNHNWKTNKSVLVASYRKCAFSACLR